MSDRVKIRVRDLRRGDLLWPTRRRILWAGQRAKTPSGKTEVHLSDLNTPDSYYAVNWGSNTLVAVTRDAA
jgi:hypothetical protein